jgi:hypothetical protein
MLVKEVVSPENACCPLFHPRQSADETGDILKVCASAFAFGKVNPPLQKAAIKEEKHAELL